MQGAITEILDVIRVRTETVISQAMFSNPASGNNRLLATTIGPAWAQVMHRLAGNDREIRVNFNITLQNGVRRYAVPPHMGNIREFVKLDSEQRVEKYIRPKGDRHPFGWGWRVEHNYLNLSFDPKDLDGQVWTLRYVPSADILPHEGTAGSATGTTLVLAATPTIGVLDTRPNAYLGGLVRILGDSNGIMQERVVTAYDVTTRTATVDAWSPTPGGTILYDILPPLFTRSVMYAVALTAARMMMSPGSTADKFKRMSLEAEEAVNAAQESVRRLNGVSAVKADEPTYDGPMVYDSSYMLGHL